MSVWQLASESPACRRPRERQGEPRGADRPTITISSLGPMGGIASTPVINPPQVAIIAVNKIEEKLVPIDGEIEVRKRMNLSLSCDHRVVDGWDAASFLPDMKPLIENPLRLLFRAGSARLDCNMTIRPSRTTTPAIEPAARFFTPDETALRRDREEWDNEGGAARPCRSWLDRAVALPSSLHASDGYQSRKRQSNV
jgi:hypothetical protein